MSNTVLTLRLPEDGESSTAKVATETIDDLKDMQAIVDGLIQPCDLWEDDKGAVCLYVNEEGLMIDLPYNRTASDLLASQWIPKFGSSNPLMGNAFISRYNFETGETESLTDDDIKKSTELLKRFA